MSDIFKGIMDGAKTIGIILGIVIGSYGLAIFGLMFVGILANLVINGDVSVPAATNTTVGTTLTSFNTLTGTVLSPYTTIAALVIVGVIVAIFWKKGKVGTSMSGVN